MPKMSIYSSFAACINCCQLLSFFVKGPRLFPPGTRLGRNEVKDPTEMRQEHVGCDMRKNCYSCQFLQKSPPVTAATPDTFASIQNGQLPYDVAQTLRGLL